MQTEINHPGLNLKNSIKNVVFSKAGQMECKEIFGLHL